MSDLFDFNARASEALVGGRSADAALGQQPPGLNLGRYAPGRAPSGDSPQLEQMRAQTAAMQRAQQPAAPAEAPDPVLGYNPTTKRVFSAGQEFDLDVGPGLKAMQAGLLDQDNAELPDGFLRMRSSQIKNKLKTLYDGLGMVDATQRRMGQMAAGAGSTVRDLSGDSFGQGLENYGQGVIENNPSKISSVSDIPDMPGQFVREGIGMVAPDVVNAVAGSAAGAAIGTALAPATFGISVPVGAVLGGLAGRFLPSLFETYGSIRREQRESGMDERGLAFGAASGSAALEALLGPEAKLAAQAARRGTRAAVEEAGKVSVRDARDLLGRGAAKNLGREAVVQAAVEGPLTEVPQSAIERFGAGKSLTDEEAQTEYGLGAAFGALGGGVVSPMGATIEFNQAKSFISKLETLQEVAANPSLPSAQRVQAARAVQDIYRGQSADPETQKEIDAFREVVAALDADIAAQAQTAALAEGAPVDLLSTPALDRDRSGEQAARLAERTAQEAESSLQSATRAGQQWQDLQAQQESGLAAAQRVGEQVPALLAQRGQQVRQSGDAAMAAGEAAQPLMSRLNAENDALQPATRAGQQFDDVMSGNLETALNDPETFGPYLDSQNAAMGAEPGVASRIDPRGPTVGPTSPLPPRGPGAPIAMSLDAKPEPAQTLPVFMGVSPPAAATSGTLAGAAETAPALSSSVPAKVKPGKAKAPKAELAKDISDARATPLSPEDAADLKAALDELEASVASEPGKIKGKLTLPQGVLTGIMRALRENKNPVAYNGRDVDPTATAQYSERMRAIVDAAKTVMARADKLLNAQSNMVPTEAKSKGKFSDADARVQAAGTTQSLTEMQALLRQAVDQLREAAGSDMNVEATVAVLKKRAQKVESKSAKKAKADESMDTLLSRAWAMYKDGDLDAAESNDVTRGREIRLSRERTARGAESQPLVAAHDDGYSRRPIKRRKNESDAAYAKRAEAAKEKGVLGMLAYMQRHGTGFERLLSSAVGRALRRAGTKNAPQPEVEFIPATETPRYDPKANKLFVHETASPEELLHETLHASLQWYVYSNPDLPEVTQLRAALKAVLDFKGDMPPKAREVVEVLRRVSKGRSKTAELDAVLELISYGSTLRDFRNFMKTMPAVSDGSWYAGITTMWKKLTALVQSMLGVSNSLANDVLDATVALLEQASIDAEGPPGAKGKRKGNVLQATVTSYDNIFDTVDDLPATEYKQYVNRILPNWLSTEVVFNKLRWGERVAGKLSGDDGVFSKIGEWVIANQPMLARWISLFNARFGVDTQLSSAYTEYKNSKQAGYNYAERVARIIERDPKLGMEVLQYLDGDTRKLQGEENAPLREQADKLTEWRDKYVQDLPEAQRRFFTALKFSEGMVFAKTTADVASRTFGASDLRKLAAVKTEIVDDLDNSWTEYDGEGNRILDGRFYRVLEKGTVAKGGTAGFISEWRAKQMLGDAAFEAKYTIEPGFVWQFSGKVNAGYKFSAAKTLNQAMTEPEAVANALRNTMSMLAGTYASVEFSKQIDTFGYKGGRPTARAVVFADEAAIAKVFGSKPAEGSILNGSQNEAKSRYVLNLYRSKHQWVRVPKGAAYGPLAGKLMQGTAWNAMQDMSNRQPIVGLQSANDMMRYFKKAKTIYNPGTHLTNVLTNITLSMMHDISPTTVAKALRLFTLYETSPGRLTSEERRVMLAFMDSNAMIGDFSSVEVKQSLYDAMRDNMAGNEPVRESRVGAYLGQFSAYEKAKGQMIKRMGGAGKVAERFDELATQIYSAEDNAFRLAAFLTKAGEFATANNGGKVTDEQLTAAGNFAKWAFLDYDIDAYAVRALRQTVMPFVSWTYAIAPVIGHIALHKPWKIANLLIAYYMFEQAMQMAAGDDDEEDEAKRAVGPKYIRDRMFGFGPYAHVRVPFMGDDDKPVYYRLGAYIPLSNYADSVPNSFLGLSGWPAPMTPGGPFVSAVLALTAGVDPYTGKPLASPTASDLQDLGKRAQFMASQFLPNLPIVSASELSKLDAIVNDRQGLTGVDLGNLQIARWAGLKMYDYHLGEGAAQQQVAVKAITREFEAEISKLRRAEARMEQPDWEGFTKKRAELLQRMQERTAEATGDE